MVGVIDSSGKLIKYIDSGLLNQQDEQYVIQTINVTADLRGNGNFYIAITKQVINGQISTQFFLDNIFELIDD